MKRLFIAGLILISLLPGLTKSFSAEVPPPEIPPELMRWQNWVLYGRQEALCPVNYNDGAVVNCRWPTRLTLDIGAESGKFEQDWLMFAEGWVPLPGSGEIWPGSVTVDGESAAVISRGDTPAVRLSPGEHRIIGRFSWRRMPEMIPVPPALGLLSLSIEKRSVQAPVVDDSGRLWLQKRATGDSGEDELNVQVFRLLEDSVPLQVTTLLRLKVSGKSREIDLAGGVIPQSIPMSIDSPLPARITNQGRLTVQARAGRWEVWVTARMEGPQSEINSGAGGHGNEIWSFKPRHELRMVEILNAPPMEPGQTEMPGQWRSYQAFLIKPDSILTIKELRRGDPDPASDQLTLKRTFWLDFDGGGMTVRDKLSGTLNRQWYLAVNPPTMLGRVGVDGQDQMITLQGPEKKMGIELRKGKLDIVADARLQDFSGTATAVGWDHDVQSMSAVLHLPPGWRLFSAAGVDSVSDSWLQRWSLLDFFLVLIIALATYKLRSLQWGIAAFATMVLIYHEPGAPHFTWLHILAVLALLPLLSHGWIKRLVALWGIGSMVVLLVIALPFVIQQIRWGLYPQLMPSYTRFYDDRIMADLAVKSSLDEEVPADVLEARKPYPTAPRKSVKRRAGLSESLSYQRRPAAAYQSKEVLLQQQDPDAAIPTGPGLPDWRWQSINLKWNGPVSKEQELKLYLLSPLINLLLALIRVGLLILMIWILIDWPSIRKYFLLKGGTATALLLATTGAVLFQPEISSAADNEFPPQPLLEELRQRLLEKPDCLPHCADIVRMELTAKGNDLRIMLRINSGGRTAVPLPVNRKSWTPDRIMLDYTPIAGLVRDGSGHLWAFIPKGVHTLVLTGGSHKKDVLQIPLPLKPHGVTYSVEGWRVEGIHADGRVGSNIQLTRMQPTGKTPSTLKISSLQPFLTVKRELQLGLSWQTVTTVTRLTPTGSPVVIKIPLLANESVTTPGIEVEHDLVLINLAADQRTIKYIADLKMTAAIELKAPKNVPWTETWTLTASPVWHCELAGIPVVHHQDDRRQWQPRWRPWPGEKVSIRVHRPAAVKAQTRTIDRAALTLTPGKRFGRGEFRLNARTSRGGQHTIQLPPKADLQQVTVNGRSLPVRMEGNRVTVPLQPGKQNIGVTWQQMTPFAALFRTPMVNIGEKDESAANAKVTINMPDQRWVLLVGGPQWGPAVLFWSYLLAIVLVAVALGRVSFLPLKTWQWILLGLGLTQVSAVTALIIAGWLILLGLRERQHMPANWFFFNTIQIGLVIWTLAALIALFTAVKSGLIGMPEMQIAGNQSSHRVLHWTQDHVQGTLPRPWVFSLSVWVYRLLMLAWSLWLAQALLKWLKWGWRSLNKDGFWRKIVLRRPKGAQATATEKEA